MLSSIASRFSVSCNFISEYTCFLLYPVYCKSATVKGKVMLVCEIDINYRDSAIMS
jgi:hypothetical protein